LDFGAVYRGLKETKRNLEKGEEGEEVKDVANLTRHFPNLRSATTSTEYHLTSSTTPATSTKRHFNNSSSSKNKEYKSPPLLPRPNLPR
jgi:hypothetical protein